jgi:WD40 repeat protein
MTQECERILVPFGGARSIAFTPTGKLLSLELQNGDLRLEWKSAWEDTRTHWLSDMALSPDGETLAVGLEDGNVSLLRVYSGELLHMLKVTNNFITSVAFSPDGEKLAVGETEGIVWLLQVEDDKFSGTPTKHKLAGCEISSVSFSPEGQHLAFGTAEGLIQMWEVKTQRPKYIITEYEGKGCQSVSFSRDGHLLVAAMSNRVVCLQASDGNPVSKWHTNRGTRVALSPDGAVLASGSSTTVELRDVKSGRLVMLLPFLAREVKSVSFSPDGGMLAVGTEDPNGVCLLSTRNYAHLLDTKKTHSSPVKVAFSPDGRILVCGEDNGIIHAWYLENLSNAGQRD